eukprot:3349444-Pleurochrysis_carterae.AAC.2
MEVETPAPAAVQPDASALSMQVETPAALVAVQPDAPCRRERETPAPTTMQPRALAVSMEAETPITAALHPDNCDVAEET